MTTDRTQAPTGTPVPVEAVVGTPDPYDTPEYAAFIEEMAKHCRCTHTVCDGVLSGGVCDEIIEDEDE